MAFTLVAERGQTEEQCTACNGYVHPGTKTGTN